MLIPAAARGPHRALRVSRSTLTSKGAVAASGRECPSSHASRASSKPKPYAVRPYTVHGYVQYQYQYQLGSPYSGRSYSSHALHRPPCYRRMTHRSQPRLVSRIKPCFRVLCVPLSIVHLRAISHTFRQAERASELLMLLLKAIICDSCLAPRLASTGGDKSRDAQGRPAVSLIWAHTHSLRS